MTDLEAFVRGAAIGTILLLGAAFWRARPNSGFAWIGSLWLAGYIGYLLAGYPGFATWPPLFQLAIVALSLSPPFFFWAFARIVFDDEFRLRPLHFLWLALIEGTGITLAVVWQHAEPWFRDLLGFGFRLPSLVLFGHAIWLVWRGRRVDLVEARARLRVGVVIGAGIVGSVILLAGILFGPVEIRPSPLKLGETVLYLLTNLALCTALMRLDRDFVPAAPRTTLPAQRAPTPDGDPDSSTERTAATDVDATARLASLMSRDQVWRENGLTVGGLATRVGIPEYRLRRLINQQLGFRNFTAFLNEHRLAAAASSLEDPRQARIPILTIALDLGWGSIGPFNRAFRARFGITPSDYRRERVWRPNEGERQRADS